MQRTKTRLIIVPNVYTIAFQMKTDFRSQFGTRAEARDYKMGSLAFPLLASRQGGVAASSKKFREATEADAAGVVFLLYLPLCIDRKTPGLS